MHMRLLPTPGHRYCIAAMACLIAHVTPAQAQSCDCTQIVGSCAGAVSLTPTGSQKGLYGADLSITANAPQCARVEYFVDNTPAFTILVNGRTGSDRVTGTSEQPMTASRVTYQSCRVCRAGSADTGQKTSAQTRSEAEMLFDAALGQNNFNPNSKEEAFQRLASGGGSADAATTAAMMSVLQGMQQLQSSAGRTATVPTPATTSGAGTRYRTGDPCTSQGFRTCDFGGPSQVNSR